MKSSKLSRTGTIAVIVGGDLLLLVMGWFLLIAPQRSTAASIVRATAATEAQLVAAKERPVQPKSVAPQQPEIQTADLYTLSKAMPSTTDMPDVLLELDQIARASGVTLSSIMPSSAVPGNGFSVLPINLSFSGNFYSLTDLLYRLRSLVSVRHGNLQTSGRLFAVNSVGLTPNGGGTSLNANVVVDTYVYGSAPGTAPAAPAAPAPASTETTNTTTTTAPAADVAPTGH